jgi:RNA polymerase sigma-70 factor (ECF subfamily)
VLDGTGDELARLAGAGDAAAFAALVETHYDRIYRMAWRFAGSPDRAEDIAQDVCVKLATAIRSFRGDSAFTTWLFRLTYTTATDSLRKTQRLVLVEPSKMQLIAEAPSYDTPEAQLAGAELWDEVRALPPQQRDAVTLVYGEDMSHAEAARVMGCTEKTVSWHLHEAKKRLRTRLEAVA